jgi:N4-gp56 family major capsid protein
MTVEQLGVDGMTTEIRDYWDKRLLSKALLDTIYMQYGVKRNIPARSGKNISFRRFEKIDNTVGSFTLTEGTMPAETQATVSVVSATISQYGAFSKVSDVLQMQAFDPVIAEFTDAYGIQAREVMDGTVRNALSAATTVQYAGTKIQVGTSGTGAIGSGDYMTAAEILEFKRTLRRNGARPPYTLLVHPDNTKDMFEDPDIVESFLQAAPRDASNPMFTGNIGRWMGVEIVETNNLRVRSSYGMSGADVYECVMFGQEFYAVTELDALNLRMIIHPLGSGGHTDPLEQYSTIGWKASLATCILNNNFGGIIKVASSRTNAS